MNRWLAGPWSLGNAWARLLRSVTFSRGMETDQDPLQECVRAALAEDLGSPDLAPHADVTSQLTIPADRRAVARIVAKATGCVAGTAAAVLA
ncbi:MAG TPA: hypothetical protein VK348_09445, partial [Planctomycetota bacterium]|nr:hypothetical protein [Planctomycetota bacterium]